MATITATALGITAVTVTETTLDGSSDTFTFDAAKNPILILSNPTGDALSPVIDGDGSTTVFCQGVGSIDVSGGYDGFGSIAAGAVKAVRLVAGKEYLKGTIAITGGTGLVAQLLEF